MLSWTSDIPVVAEMIKVEYDNSTTKGKEENRDMAQENTDKR